ncbi:MAG: hypothetical protein AAF491_10945 [Verrucomicrobiota bacterium]
MKALSNVFIALLFLSSPSFLPGQDAPRKTADLPLFKALLGKRRESGVLIPQANAESIPGKAVSFGKPALGGLWFQIDGRAQYGPVTWEYRWMFQFQEGGGKNRVIGTYLDTMGQRITYEGLYDEENNRIQLMARLQDGGTGRFQISMESPELVLIGSVHSDANDDPQVTYSAQNVAAE